MKKLLNINLILIFLLVIYIGKWHFDNYVHKKESEQLIKQYTALASSGFSVPAYKAENTALKMDNTENEKSDVIGRICIPVISLDYPLLAVTNNENMKIGITRFSGSELNSSSGNLVLAGHNMRRSGILFSDLHKLKSGDEILLYDITGAYEAYTVFDIYVVSPDNTKPLAQDTQGKKWVTLITCTDRGRKRLIVAASKK